MVLKFHINSIIAGGYISILSNIILSTEFNIDIHTKFLRQAITFSLGTLMSVESEFLNNYSFQFGYV